MLRNRDAFERKFGSPIKRTAAKVRKSILLIGCFRNENSNRFKDKIPYPSVQRFSASFCFDPSYTVVRVIKRRGPDISIEGNDRIESTGLILFLFFLLPFFSGTATFDIQIGKVYIICARIIFFTVRNSLLRKLFVCCIFVRCFFFFYYGFLLDH